MTETPYNYWLWVTSREIAQRANLAEHKHVTWTCDKNTKAGDLILLYLNSKGEAVKGYPKSAFCYLIQANSGVRNGEHFPGWRDRGWKDACNCQVLYEFKNPVRYKDLELDPEFQKWDAYKRHNFQGKSFPIPEDIWDMLDQMAVNNNPDYSGYRTLIEMPQGPLSSIESTVEADLDSIQAEEGLPDGKKGQRYVIYYERNPKLGSLPILCCLYQGLPPSSKAHRSSTDDRLTLPP